MYQMSMRQKQFHFLTVNKPLRYHCRCVQTGKYFPFVGSLLCSSPLSSLYLAALSSWLSLKLATTTYLVFFSNRIHWYLANENKKTTHYEGWFCQTLTLGCTWLELKIKIKSTKAVAPFLSLLLQLSMPKEEIRHPRVTYSGLFLDLPV
jgi:hypothetical protein